MANPQDTPPKPSGKDEEVSKDKLFKTAVRLFFKGFVEIVDAELAATLDLEDPEFLPPEVFADFKKHGHVIPDLVAKVRTRAGEEQLLLFHVDVEARFGKAMDERVRRYSMHLELELKLPVISAVLFLKGGPTGVELRKVERKIAGRVFSTFHYFAFGLSKSLAEKYVDLPQALAPALAAFMRSKIWDKPEQKLRCRKAIRRVELPLAEAFVLDRIVVTQLQLDPAEEKRYQELERLEGKEIQEMVITWEDALEEREDKGELKATRGAIVLLANHRYGQLPDGFVDKLEAIDNLRRLYEILEWMEDVQTLEELDLTP